MNTADTPADGLRQIAEDIYAAHLAPLHAQIEALTAQRDALKTALEDMLAEIDGGCVLRKLPVAQARAALALVKARSGNSAR